MPTFKRHIFVCINQRPKDDPRGCCAARGSERLHAFFKQEVKRFNLKGIVRANKAGCLDRKSTRLNSSHIQKSRMPSSA